MQTLSIVVKEKVNQDNIYAYSKGQIIILGTFNYSRYKKNIMTMFKKIGKREEGEKAWELIKSNHHIFNFEF